MAKKEVKKAAPAAKKEENVVAKKAAPVKKEAVSKKEGNKSTKAKKVRKARSYSFGEFIGNVFLLAIGLVLILGALFIMYSPDQVGFLPDSILNGTDLTGNAALGFGVVVFLGFWISCAYIRKIWMGVLGIVKKERLEKRQAKIDKKA